MSTRMVKVQSTKYPDRIKTITIHDWGVLQAATKEWVIYVEKEEPKEEEEINIPVDPVPVKRKAGRPKTKSIEA